MDYTIVERPAFTIYGKSRRVTTKDGENMRLIPAFWQECMGDGTLDTLGDSPRSGSVFGNALLGVCTDFAADWSEFTYIIGVESNTPVAGFHKLDVGALTWSSFPAKGAVPDVIQTVWGSIWSDFFPNSGYSHGPGPDVEIYPQGNPMDPGYEFEVSIPVVKKS